MPGMTGVEMLRELKKSSPQTVRLLLTGYSDLAALVGSINEGEVFRFVKKPWDNDEIRAMVAEAAAAAEVRQARALGARAARAASPGSARAVTAHRGLAPRDRSGPEPRQGSRAPARG